MAGTQKNNLNGLHDIFVKVPLSSIFENAREFKDLSSRFVLPQNTTTSPGQS